MLAPTKVIRTNARIALKKNRTAYTVAATALIFTVLFISLGTELFSSTAGDIAAVLFLISVSVFLFFPLVLGVLRFFWRSLFDAKDGFSEVFYYFSSGSAYKRAAGVSLRLAVRVIGIAVACFIPSGIVKALCSPELYSFFNISIPNFATNLWFVQDCLYSIGLIAFLLLQLRYYLVPFLTVSNGELSTADIFMVSRMISRRNAYDFIGLIFSFAGWIILSLAAIPLLYTVPYFVMAYIVHCRFAVAQYNSVANRQYDGCAFNI